MTPEKRKELLHHAAENNINIQQAVFNKMAENLDRKPRADRVK